jgi:predicted Zn-dependent peptidase
MIRRSGPVPVLLAVALATAAPTAAVAPGGPPPRGVVLPPHREVRLPNGATLLLAERHDIPMITFHASLRGGALADPAGKEGVGQLTAELLLKGAGKRTARDMADALDGAGASLSTGSSLESSTLSAQCLARDQALLIELIRDALRSPTLPAGEFEKLRAQSIEQLLALKEDPGSVIGAYALSYFFGAHPYGRPEDGDEGTLRGITPEDVLAFYRANYGADRLILAAVGDFDSRAMEARLRAAFSGWGPCPGPAPAAPPTQRRSGRRVLLVDKPDATQAYFWIGNLGVSRTDPDRVALGIANTAFGGRFTSMLNSELRTKSGLSYSARCRLVRWTQPGTVAISSFTRTESTAKAVDLALELLARLRREYLGADVVASVQAYIRGQYPPDFETSGAVAGALVDLARNGLGRDEIEGYLARVSATDSATVARAIHRVYPPGEDLTFVFVGNAAALRSVVRKYGPVAEVPITKPMLEALRGE